MPYKRIYGVDEPQRLAPLANDGKQSTHLPEGTPFGLVGTSSLYKRESYPYGVVQPGSVTATFAGDKDPTGHRGLRHVASTGRVQGADAGLYANDDIHAIRILLLEPTTETAEERPRASTTTPASGCASSARSRCASSTATAAAARPGRQSRHQLPREDPGRRRLDVPDARQETAWC